MQIQNVSDPVFYNFCNNKIYIIAFRMNHDKAYEHSINVLQLIDLLHVLKVTLADKLKK